MRALNLSNRQREVIQRSFEKVEVMQDATASLFYQQLFELAPNLRCLFKGDLVTQGRKLMRTMSLLSRNLDETERLQQMLEKLGARHVDYGVEEHHYPPFRIAFLRALETGLGQIFDEEHREAWDHLLQSIGFAMLNGATKSSSDIPCPVGKTSGTSATTRDKVDSDGGSSPS